MPRSVCYWSWKRGVLRWLASLREMSAVWLPALPCPHTALAWRGGVGWVGGVGDEEVGNWCRGCQMLTQPWGGAWAGHTAEIYISFGPS